MFKLAPEDSARKNQLDGALFQIRSRAPAWFILSDLVSITFTNDPKNPTACTNGKHIWFDAEFWAKLSRPERVFVILHEVMHVARKHHLKRHERQHTLWNISCDFVINLSLDDMAQDARYKGLLSAPKVGLCLDQKYRSRTEGEVYAELMANAITVAPQPWGDVLDGDPGQDDALGPGKPGNGNLPGSDAPGNLADEIARIDKALERATMVDKTLSGKHGSGAGGLETIVAQARKNSPDIAAWLSKFMSQFGGATWSRPHKRLHAAGITYAGPRKSVLSKLVFAIDTSYSLDRKVLEGFIGTLFPLFARSEFTELHIVMFHDSIYETKVIRANGRPDIGTIQGGGTCFQPAFDYTREVGAKALIMFTDGECTIPEKPSYPVLWVLDNDRHEHIKYGTKLNIVG